MASFIETVRADSFNVLKDVQRLRCNSNCRTFVPTDFSHRTNSSSGCFLAPLQDDLCDECNDIIIHYIFKKYCVRNNLL